jgi:polyphenol oxidase
MLLRFDSFDHPDLVHAITTRQGGASLPPHDTLNMAFSRPDDPAAVRENRRRVYTALEVAPERVVQAGQIHAADVLVVDDRHAGRGALERASVLPPADALITRTHDLYLLACFADCTPLLFFDPVQRAVGVAHAGWQGTAKQIAAATVRAMHDSFGTQPDDLRVVVGPSAGPCCYNVWPHVAATIRSELPFAADVLFDRNGETFFDLWAANVASLVAAGVRRANIEVSRICTIDHADRFFSHRASGGNTGRFAAIVGVRS